MEPIIKTIESMTVVGMEYYGQNENHEISTMWGVFNGRCKTIPHLAGKGEAYGVCSCDGKQLHYIAGLPVTKVDTLPEGMVSCTIPAGTYAVFTYRGTLANLQKTYEDIYKTWLPSSTYQRDDVRPDVEWYDERFTTGNDPASAFDICIPVMQK